MTPRTPLLLIAACVFPAASLFAQVQIAPEADPQTPATHRLVWPTMSGQRYEVRMSADLQTWTVAPGFPVTAEGPELTFPIVAEGAAWFFQVVTLEKAALNGMVLIPAGTFQMGDSLNDSVDSYGERPTHTVYVSAFYMDQHEVTQAMWDEVYTWALTQGYSFDNQGSVEWDGANRSKGPNHPVYHINWHDVVKWCNARSEKAGLLPSYYTDVNHTQVYRSGQVDVRNEWVKWQGNGYRLPTEAEWEKAARGGLEGRRFPWGDTVSHSQANYRSYWEFDRPVFAYDVSPTAGFHPTYTLGGHPYTSPVGSFLANGYGLYDVAGNVWEWCWDWWSESYYGSSPGTDPLGPESGFGRLLRGGSWLGASGSLRCAFRTKGHPSGTVINWGFRCVSGL